MMEQWRKRDQRRNEDVVYILVHKFDHGNDILLLRMYSIKKVFFLSLQKSKNILEKSECRV
jgi:hypothetical protein